MVNQMAYVNVAEWSPEHVAEWLRGLEYSLLPYVQFFLNNGIYGRHLLNLTANDLEDLHIFKIGHQQLILEAVELLKQLHYTLNSETLQSLAVKLSCKARSLHNDLKLNGPRDNLENIRQERVSTNVLSAVSEVLTSVKALVSWLDRPPFQQDSFCIKLKKTVLKLSIELASTTQRDQFAERPHSLIKKYSAYIAELCDQFVQNSMDSLILQPASLDIAMIKKKPDEELGIHIKSTYAGVHIIGGIKDQSPAKCCNKVERGDEIVQVNYQTVIGWQQKKLVTTMTEHSTELQLTLKKRPRHVNLLGEVIILRPYRIPSKKTAKICYIWPEDNQLSGLEIGSKSNENECLRDNFQDDDDDSAFLPASSNTLLLTKEMSLQNRLYEGTSSAAVQRRATVSGASPTVLKPAVKIEDLINGVLSSKSNDHFNRSISHDPAYFQEADEYCLDKSCSVLYNWEDTVTEFHGRRPSAHDISNEIAGSKETDINPVFLRKASKLESSPVDNDYKETQDLSSYQVVIVAGVPQKCIPVTKGEKEEKRSFDLLMKPYRFKGKLAGEFGNRHISCKDLGKGDCEGWLYKRKERKGLFPVIHQWAKRWIVLKDNFLYCYKDKNDIKAESLIALPGSIVSPVVECKVKKFAFKIYHQRIHFYLATESQRDLTNWMNKMGLAAIAYNAPEDIKSNGFLKADVVLGLANHFYSETDDSENSSPTFSRHNRDNHFAEASIHDRLVSSQPTNKTLVQSWNKSLSISTPSSKDKYSCSLNQDFPSVEVCHKSIINKEKMSALIKTKISSMKSYPSELYAKSMSKNGYPENSRISYNISTSCAESYAYLRDAKKYTRTISDESIFGAKMQCDDAYYDGGGTNCNSIGEEYDATSSFRRQQKPIGNEITPGLVARMAVSYTNLSKKNTMTTSLNKKYRFNKSIAAPGYVAKISDSFDHLAMLSKSNIFNLEMVHQDELSDNERHASLSNEKITYKSYKYKRSVSESQVTTNIQDLSQNSHVLSVETSHVNSQLLSHHTKPTLPPPEKFISLLDKEYNKVFEGKKVSQQQIKSPNNENMFNNSNFSKREQRFFPSNCPTENVHSLTVNQSMKNDHKTCENLTTTSKGTNSNMIANKSSSLPYTGNTSSEVNYLNTISNQFTEKVIPSYCGIENVGFQDQVSLDNSGFNCLQSSFRNTNSKQKPVPQFENSSSSYEFHHQHRNSPNEATSEIDSPKTSFKFFNSPKFMKKLTSPKLDKKNIFKSKKHAKELKKAEQKEIAICQNERSFFGSPILVRAFFGSPKIEKKIVTVSSGVQTDIALLTPVNPTTNETLHDQNLNQNIDKLDISRTVSSHLECSEEVTISASSSSSSLNSNISYCVSPFTNSVYYVEARIKPQITVSLPLVTDNRAESKASSDFSHTPLKPMMGVAMLNKKRLPSISGESSLSVSSSKSSQDGSFRETTQVLSKISMEINGDEDTNQELKAFNEANTSFYSSTVPNSEDIENSGTPSW